MKEDRAITLLRATLELLRKCDNSHYVLDVLGETVYYDEADCDGYCLKDDIEHYLEWEVNK
jgi:hypothetical protein